MATLPSQRTSGVRRSRGSPRARSRRRSGESPATCRPRARTRGLSRSISAAAPKRAAKRRSSPRVAGRSSRSTKCTGTRRSAKKRSALRVSWQSVKPKIWTFTVKPFQARLAPRPYSPRTATPGLRGARLQLLPDAEWDRRRSGVGRLPGLGPVIVGAAGRDEAERPAHLAVRRGLSRRVLRIVGLDPHEPRAHEVGDEVIAPGEAGVRHHRHTPRSLDDANRVRGREALARNVRRTARAQVAIERLAHGPDVPVVDHDLGDVGPSRGAFLHERQDLGGVDGHAELGEPLRHTVDTLPALRALLGEEVLKPPGLPIHAVAEDVNLGGPAVRPARHVAVDLEPWDDRSEEHTSELQPPVHLVCRLLPQEKLIDQT